MILIDHSIHFRIHGAQHACGPALDEVHAESGFAGLICLEIGEDFL